MNRDRVLGITLMTVGALMFLGGVVWFWLGYRAARTDAYSDFNQVWPYGTAFVGLLVAGGGAAAYRSE